MAAHCRRVADYFPLSSPRPAHWVVAADVTELSKSEREEGAPAFERDREELKIERGEGAPPHRRSKRIDTTEHG